MGVTDARIPNSPKALPTSNLSHNSSSPIKFSEKEKKKKKRSVLSSLLLAFVVSKLVFASCLITVAFLDPV